ncbi:hypothetical protein AQUCO_08600046v1 [Aquilegia coerulea]|uniref:Uncharacterized protein n=1 Tax=Aquilegia coerulea TaxID=218851 RepID=A0A2G5C6K3_AQUCA|nr:hypothetical protein AQUCO_08600046v1 [Aquilegia coerulea]
MLKSILLVFIVVCFVKTIQFGLSVNGSSLHCPQNERSALLDFKGGLIDQTNRLSSWVGQDCCKWEGVICDNFTGHVVRLNLRNPFPLDWDRYYDSGRNYDKTYSEACLIAVGEVNPSLLELRHLNSLDLSWNNFSGIVIPKFFGLFLELSYLNLSSAQFGGIVPHHLGNLSTLRSLDLGTDHLLSTSSYNIPSLVANNLHWTSTLFSLRLLDMSGIDLSNIPFDSFQTITSFPSLLELHFSDCSLGKIPLFHSNPKNLTSLTILDLSHNFFQGPIPSAIRNMTSLKVIQLSDNQFSSNLTNWLHQLKSLNIIDLSYNSFEGEIPTSFSALQSLEELHLDYNQLSGHIPTSLTKLSALQVLDLRNNFLSGPIPTSLGTMSALTELALDSNQLSGDIPLSFGKLSNMKMLSLAFNQFSGTVPDCLGQFSQLTELNLGSNQFQGVVSGLHFARLSKLKYLDLGMNSLSIKIQSGWVPPFQLKSVSLESCVVGPQFPDWLQTQMDLDTLNMSSAGISDSIPNWFHNLTALVQLDLSRNQIYGKVPNFTRNMVELYLSSNRFEGSFPQLPSGLLDLDLSNNTICGPIRADIGYTVPDLRFLDLSENSINGTIPKSLCKMFSLSLLDFSKNHLSGDLPRCWGGLVNLEVIDLTSNNLSGTIHASFFHAPMNLRTLHLGKNNFHGELPLSLKNCTSLSILDVGDNKFSGVIPTWIGKSLFSLRFLRLNSNKYNGNLSRNLCHLKKLQVLDTAGNNLSGNIPHCFGSFNAMQFNQTDFVGVWGIGIYKDKLSQVIKGRELEYKESLRFVTNMDLSNNNFVGHIPEQLTNLSGLIGLNLSRNHLTGCVPMKIGQMKSLESLDLSNNRLSGTIPKSIKELTTLSYLNLSNNNLSGRIPLGNQLQTLYDASIYDGNSELCGLPLKKKCIRDEAPRTPTYVGRRAKGKQTGLTGDGDGDGDGDGFITIWFYIGMSWGYVAGFWGFCGVLLFKKSWRKAYSVFVNDMVDSLF